MFGVSSSRGRRWLVVAFAVLLLLSLGGKFLIRPAYLGDSLERAAQQRVVDFLARQRFVVSIAENVREGQPMVRAAAGECRILVARSPAMGWDRDLIRQYKTLNDVVFTVFEGRVYAEQPTWRTVTNFLLARLQRELGLRVSAEPTLAVVASDVCGAERLPWADLSFAVRH